LPLAASAAGATPAAPAGVVQSPKSDPVPRVGTMFYIL
jgi:hypothetical protein